MFELEKTLIVWLIDSCDFQTFTEKLFRSKQKENINLIANRASFRRKEVLHHPYKPASRAKSFSADIINGKMELCKWFYESAYTIWLPVFYRLGS